MVTEIDEKQWKHFISRQKLPVFFNPLYLNCVAGSFNTSIRYFLVTNEESINAAIAVFVKNRCVVSPENFTHTPLWISESLDERQQLDVIKQFLQYMKASFSKITLRLGLEIFDIRAFVWEGFKVENRFTYIKEPIKPSHYSIAKNLKHQSINNYQCVSHKPDGVSIDINIRFLKALGYSSKKSRQFHSLLLSLTHNGFLQAYSLFKDTVCLGSSLVLVDHASHRAYMLVSNPIDRSEKYAHTLLYQFTIDSLMGNGIKEIDFCGANMESIAYFKSFFNPELSPYFIVWYSSIGNKLKPVFRLLDRI